jgi:hypothetical protein
MTTEKIRVRHSSVIRSAAEIRATPARRRLEAPGDDVNDGNDGNGNGGGGDTGTERVIARECTIR